MTFFFGMAKGFILTSLVLLLAIPLDIFIVREFIGTESSNLSFTTSLAISSAFLSSIAFYLNDRHQEKYLKKVVQEQTDFILKRYPELLAEVRQKG